MTVDNWLQLYVYTTLLGVVADQIVLRGFGGWPDLVALLRVKPVGSSYFQMMKCAIFVLIKRCKR